MGSQQTRLGHVLAPNSSSPTEVHVRGTGLRRGGLPDLRVAGCAAAHQLPRRLHRALRVLADL
jgi:hypothetical protein